LTYEIHGRESAMAKTTKSHCPLKFYTKPTAANSEMKKNLDPSQATLTTDKKRTDLVVLVIR
jgi:hypothetical protein